MIEAVNSVLSNTSANRVATEQQSTLRSYATNPDRVQEVARAPYVSPHISIDKNYNKAILQIRDSDTGDVLRQYPTEGQLKAYRTAQQFSERQKARAHVEAPSTKETPTHQPVQKAPSQPIQSNSDQQIGVSQIGQSSGNATEASEGISVPTTSVQTDA